MPSSLVYPRAVGAFLTHPGVVRSNNEDAVLFGVSESASHMEEPLHGEHDGSEPWLIAVADGLGGHLAGERASQEVVEALACCEEITPHGINGSLCEINRKLFELGEADIDLSRMGATVAGLACGPQGLFAFNVGDARVYRQQGEFLRRLTRDDSVAELLAEAAGGAGPIDPRRMALNVLTQSLGGSSQYREINPHIYPVSISGPTRFLLCSDGLSDTLTQEEMEGALLSEDSAESMVSDLLERSLSEKARDNVSLIVVELSPVEV